MVHAVHNGVCPRAHIRRPLGDVSKNKKYPLPEFVHLKGAVGGIPVLEKRLAKQRGIPDYDKENDHRHKKNLNG